MPAQSLIAIITDFGDQDPFVGIMKGVIAGISPRSRIVDINHNLPQGDILRAAVQLWMAKAYFPKGTVFLAVVDPGVGTTRKGLIIQDQDYTFIGPDNGIFTFAVEQDAPAWELGESNFRLVNGSNTFHGRDIFAPAAAHVANGVSGQEFGRAIKTRIALPGPKLVVDKARITGQVLYSDRFGNLLTSLGRFTRLDERRYQFQPWLPAGALGSRKLNLNIDRAIFQLHGGQMLSWVETFADISPGECAGLVGSSGLLEIAAMNNSAHQLTKLSAGDTITLLF